jgi:hypothetical protein
MRTTLLVLLALAIAAVPAAGVVHVHGGDTAVVVLALAAWFAVTFLYSLPVTLVGMVLAAIVGGAIAEKRGLSKSVGTKYGVLSVLALAVIGSYCFTLILILFSY